MFEPWVRLLQSRNPSDIWMSSVLIILVLILHDGPPAWQSSGKTMIWTWKYLFYAIQGHLERGEGNCNWSEKNFPAFIKMIFSVEIITALLWDITMLNIMLKARWISTSFWDFCLETRFCRLFFFWEVNSFPPCQLLIVRTPTKETLTGNPFILTPFFNLMTKSQRGF